MMRIKKVLLEDSGKALLTSSPENTLPGDENFRVGFSASRLSEESVLNFGTSGISSCHVLMDGVGECTHDGQEKHKIAPAEVVNCEEGDHIGLTGNGIVFNMLMAGGVRGFIREQILTAELKLRVGESVGASVQAFFGYDSGFTVLYNGESLYCEKGSGIVLEMENHEFMTITLVPENDGMRLGSATGVMLKSHDFGKYIGVHFLERREGVCKARLDIRKEHMNPIGTVHGGCLFTLADAVCGMAASSLGGICTTVNSNIQFLNAAFYPAYLTAEAKPKKIGRKLRTFVVEIRDDKDVLISTVDMVFYCLQK